MIATDQGKNPRVSSQPATVRVRVARNERAPVFQQEGSYTKNINRNQAANSAILTVGARDEDSTVSSELSADLEKLCRAFHEMTFVPHGALWSACLCADIFWLTFCASGNLICLCIFCLNSTRV